MQDWEIVILCISSTPNSRPLSLTNSSQSSLLVSAFPPFCYVLNLDIKTVLLIQSGNLTQDWWDYSGTLCFQIILVLLVLFF